LPVMLLLTVGVACVIYSDIPAEGLGTFAGKPLSLGLALVPVTFFVIHLTNRRYGATYAFAQVIAAWALGLLGLPTLLSMISLPEEIRALTGFGAGLFFAQIVAVVLFDGLRGPTWWKAPLFASLLGGLLLCVIAFPVSLGGTGMNWSKEMLSYMELVAGAAVLLLIPYGLLRSLVPPRPGYDFDRVRRAGARCGRAGRGRGEVEISRGHDRDVRVCACLVSNIVSRAIASAGRGFRPTARDRRS